MPYQFANLHIAFVRNFRLSNDTESLGSACMQTRGMWQKTIFVSLKWFVLSSLLSYSVATDSRANSYSQRMISNLAFRSPLQAPPGINFLASVHRSPRSAVPRRGAVPVCQRGPAVAAETMLWAVFALLPAAGPAADPAAGPVAGPVAGREPYSARRRVREWTAAAGAGAYGPR